MKLDLNPTGGPIAPIRDAATILLLRGEAPFEIFMVRRTARAKFMASAMVFPGGRLDEADASDALAARCDLDRAGAARRMGLDDGAKALALLVAGVRETFEEAGVLLARRSSEAAPLTLDDPQTAARFTEHRRALNAGERSLAEIAEAEDLVLCVDALAFYARWVTPPNEKRRYDARFLLTRAPAGQTPLHDAVETTASTWLTAKAALAAHDSKGFQLAPPTFRVLLELSLMAGASAAMTHSFSRVPAPILPQFHAADGTMQLLLPGDPDFDPPGSTRNRIVLRDGRWWSEGHPT